MRFINIKDFHKNMWEHTKELPVVVTKYGKPVFIIIDWREYTQDQKDS